MERRELLQMGGLFGIGMTLGGGTGCLPRVVPRHASDAEMTKVLATLDENLERVSRYDMLDDFTRRANTNARYTDNDRALSRMSMRSLYMSATFRSLPEEAQMHPAMQERVIKQLPEMDEAIFGMTDRMSTLAEDRREFVRAALHRETTGPEAISQVFDQGMGVLDMPLRRRFQMRSIFAQVGFRMQKQPAVVIDEYVNKVHKTTALIGSQVELQRRIAAQIGQDAYWKHQHRLALMLADDPNGPPGGGGGGGGLMPPQRAPVAPMPPGAVDTTQEVEILMVNVLAAAQRGQCEAVDFMGRRIAELDPNTYRSRFLADRGVQSCKEMMRQRGMNPPMAADCADSTALAHKLARSKVIGTGGWMLGIGLITGLVSLAAIESGIGVVGLTVGAGLLVGGLIVLIVGAAMDG